jgi:hypothetical protein
MKFEEMSEYDQDNLDFLLFADEKVLSNWQNEMDVDDISYALELLETAKWYIIAKQVEIEMLNTLDYSAANAVLSKYMLSKNGDTQ